LRRINEHDLVIYRMDFLMPGSEWYDALLKPCWSPSPETIGLTWTLL